jgi:mannose-6-phosphate isomerase
VLAALLLNRQVLGPGEAVYLAAGNMHAYLRGTAVEIMANSDNILRGGLTPKHVDVPELLRIVDFGHGALDVQLGEPVAEHVWRYRTDAPEFELTRLDWDAGHEDDVPLRHAGPQMLLCTDGAVTLTDQAGDTLKLCRGDSAWLPASACVAGPVLAAPCDPGPVRVFRATAGPV